MWLRRNEVKKGHYWWAYGEGDKVIILVRKVLPSGELMYYRMGNSSMFQSLPRDTDRFWPIEAPELEE